MFDFFSRFGFIMIFRGKGFRCWVGKKKMLKVVNCFFRRKMFLEKCGFMDICKFEKCF